MAERSLELILYRLGDIEKTINEHVAEDRGSFMRLDQALEDQEERTRKYNKRVDRLVWILTGAIFASGFLSGSGQASLKALISLFVK